MLRSSRLVRVLVCAVGAGALSCSDNTVTGPTGATLRIIAGAGISDTVTALPSQALVVEVRGPDGKPATGTVVRFLSLPIDATHPYTLGVLVSSPTSTFFTGFDGEHADARGRATTLLQFGGVTGNARVAIQVPEFNLADTVPYTVHPGAAVGMAVFPRDTVLYRGASMQSRAAAVDRFGNSRSDPVTYGPASGGITISATGAVAAGSNVGRAWFVAHAAGAQDTGWVSIVPAGMIAAYDYPSSYGDTAGLVVVNLDGSGYHRLSVGVTQYGASPVWSPAGDRIVYDVPANGGAEQLFATSLGGGGALFLQSPPTALLAGTWPSFSHDGAHVFFSGLATGEGNFSLWQADADGHNAVQVGRNVGCCGIDWRSSPSPDGTRLAFITGDLGGTSIRVWNVVADTEESWSVTGQSPRWSPTGGTIAYTTVYGGPLHMVNADGTNSLVLTPNRSYAEGALGWSPDGQWLIARGPATLELVNPTTGAFLPLGWATNLWYPAWRP